MRRDNKEKKGQKRLDGTESWCMRQILPFWLFLTLESLSHKVRLHPSVRSCYLCSFGSHIKTPAAHRPLSAHLLWEISLRRNGVDYVDLVWHGLLEQSECQNVTNLAEPSVPKSPLSIPTSILKRHSVTGGSAAVEDMADLTTTWWFSAWNNYKTCWRWNLPYLFQLRNTSLYKTRKQLKRSTPETWLIVLQN